MTSQYQKAKEFHALHHREKMLVLPNTWEPLGSLMIEKMGFPAIATTSYAMALTNGVKDGENMDKNLLFQQFQNITQAVKIPVTVDFEKGYIDLDSIVREEEQLADNIKKLIEIGVVGINIEDTNVATNRLVSIASQCEKIRIIRKVAENMKIPLFINARTDAYISEDDFSMEEKLAESIKRANAYQAAGADGVYPIFMQKPTHIQAIVEEVSLPINIMITPDSPELLDLEKWGVKRTSFASSFMKIGYGAMYRAAQKILQNRPLDEFIEKEITGVDLSGLL